MSKKKIIIIICSLVLVIGAGLFITIHSINNFASTSEEESLNSDNETLEVEESDVILDEDIEEDELLEDTTEITESSDNGTSNESNNSSIKTDTSNNSSSNNSSNNSSSNSTTSNDTSTTSESDTTTSTDTSTTDTSSSASSYIGVPYPYDFNYSYHHGVIEYSSTEACLSDVPDIAFKDTVDIINIDCLDVVDGTGTILGVYMYINCTSGNCNKYK